MRSSGPALGPPIGGFGVAAGATAACGGAAGVSVVAAAGAAGGGAGVEAEAGAAGVLAGAGVLSGAGVLAEWVADAAGAGAGASAVVVVLAALGGGGALRKFQTAIPATRMTTTPAMTMTRRFIGPSRPSQFSRG